MRLVNAGDVPGLYRRAMRQRADRAAQTRGPDRAALRRPGTAGQTTAPRWIGTPYKPWRSM
ncbi:hypothetical protein [Lysobacter gummosus]|uniref:hypothetical protein n=1 Tax=Lysobacter gummosus TaxID=262324 RepID=UPI00363F681D